MARPIKTRRLIKKLRIERETTRSKKIKIPIRELRSNSDTKNRTIRIIHAVNFNFVAKNSFLSANNTKKQTFKYNEK
jgi:hypothetical protein